LALSNKTTAIGSIALHLVHGLRNPLSAVKSHLESMPANKTESSEAISAVDRMGAMIDSAVMTLRENEGGVLYQITIQELLGVFEDRFSPIAVRHNIILNTESKDKLELDNREASLILLIIENIICNSIEACGDQGEIFLSTPNDGVISVSDNGPGIPENVKEKLFQAGVSTKGQGSGLGLAISKQLSVSIGAELCLVATGKNGTTFELRLASSKGCSTGSIKDSS
jgi:signal transduction histidine kinase